MQSDPLHADAHNAAVLARVFELWAAGRIGVAFRSKLAVLKEEK